MTDPVIVPVQIVRPKQTFSALAGWVLSNWLGLFATTAIVMLLIGACHQEVSSRIPPFGYLQTLLGLFTLRCIVSAVGTWDTYKFWSRETKARRG